jgi:hypothetical protein
MSMVAVAGVIAGVIALTFANGNTTERKALRMDQHSFKIAIKYRGRHKKVLKYLMPLKLTYVNNCV